MPTIESHNRALFQATHPLRAGNQYQCGKTHIGHRSFRGKRPLTSQGDGLHVNGHKNIKTSFMFVQPWAHNYTSHSVIDITGMLKWSIQTWPIQQVPKYHCCSQNNRGSCDYYMFRYSITMSKIFSYILFDILIHSLFMVQQFWISNYI